MKKPKASAVLNAAEIVQFSGRWVFELEYKDPKAGRPTLNSQHLKVAAWKDRAPVRSLVGTAEAESP
ncbi:MAG: hypothetical protein ACSHYB_06380 [Roseibacillus sp.]